MAIYQNTNCLSQLLKQSQVTLKDRTVQHFGSKEKKLCLYIQIYIKFLKYGYSCCDT